MDGHSEREMEVRPAQVCVDQDDLVSKYGETDAEVGGQDGFTSPSLASRDSPDTLLQTEVFQENRRGTFRV